ncbi:MAG: hypothetical protein HQM08_12430 [Candidatus Riflebacteria bacterium]|nr:hypothetical protein [Candidatus Riflebacteria bacterium]
MQPLPGNSRLPVLFVSPCAFDSIRQRHHAFAELFSENGFPTLFINPLKTSGFSISIAKINKMNILSIRVPFKAAQFPGINAIAVKIALTMVKNSGVSKNSVLWIGDPAFSSATDWKWSSIVYDRCDLHGFFPGQIKSAWRKHESAIYKRADVIFATTELIKKDSENNGAKNVVLLPNAVHSSWVKEKRTSFPMFPPLRIISAGAHFEWIDFKWLEMFTNNPKISLNIVGPGRGCDFSRLINLPGVTYHGIVGHDKLRQIVDSCHVGLIPFKKMKLTLAVDPIKAYEYKARGLLIWSSDIPELFHHPFVDRVVEDSDELKKAIKEYEFNRSYNLSEPGMTGKIILPTWEERFREVLGQVEIK